jgi:transcriptional regulator GlxA family with amidase domain
VIAGGDGSRAAALCPRTRRFIQACATKARRTTSVCSGTYLLAAAGLLDRKRATTHWSRTTDFTRRFPQVRLDPDRIFVREGRIWTSAGITAGIDLSLALIEEDLGESVAAMSRPARGRAATLADIAAFVTQHQAALAAAGVASA